MIISEIQSEIGHCSCDSAKFKAPADFSHHAILFFTLSLKLGQRHSDPKMVRDTPPSQDVFYIPNLEFLPQRIQVIYFGHNNSSNKNRGKVTVNQKWYVIPHHGMDPCMRILAFEIVLTMCTLNFWLATPLWINHLQKNNNITAYLLTLWSAWMLKSWHMKMVLYVLPGQHRFIYRSSRDNTSELEAHVTERPQAKTSRPDNRKLK